MGPPLELDVDSHRIAISSPDKPYFPAAGLTKRDLVDYYLAISPVLMPHCLDRPCNLERYPDGIDGKHFVQKRVPKNRPDWLRTAEVTFGSGNTAEELCPASIADVLWAANLGAITVHPWSTKLTEASDGRFRADLADELRFDLDPMPGVAWTTTRRVAHLIREVLAEHEVTCWVKTSGSAGIHVIARIVPSPYVDVRAAAVAVAREAERRSPADVTASWWKEQRGRRVFIDYNQNLWDRTMACAYAVRATPDARVSLPIAWDALDSFQPADATMKTVPDLVASNGDAAATLRDVTSTTDGLLAMAARDAEAGLPDLPLPPHFPKFPNEPTRVAPSRAAKRPDHG